MEESYETFEEELGPPRSDPPPQKPVRQIRRPVCWGGSIKHKDARRLNKLIKKAGSVVGITLNTLEGEVERRALSKMEAILTNMDHPLHICLNEQRNISEMYTTRKIREEMAPVLQQPKAEPKTLPREPSFTRATPLHKPLSIQNLSQVETPWENVTLNRCLFVAITILVLTSGFQRLHETLSGQRTVEEEEEEAELTMRRPGALRHRGQPPVPETSPWEVMLWWLPDLDDDEDEEEDDDDGEIKRGKSKRGVTARASSGLRNKPLPDKKLMKQRYGTLKDRRAKKAEDEEIKDKKERPKNKDPEETANEEEEDQEAEETPPNKNKKLEEKNKKKKTQTG